MCLKMSRDQWDVWDKTYSTLKTGPSCCCWLFFTFTAPALLDLYKDLVRSCTVWCPPYLSTYWHWMHGPANAVKPSVRNQRQKQKPHGGLLWALGGPGPLPKKMLQSAINASSTFLTPNTLSAVSSLIPFFFFPINKCWNRSSLRLNPP